MKNRKSILAVLMMALCLIGTMPLLTSAKTLIIPEREYILKDKLCLPPYQDYDAVDPYSTVNATLGYMSGTVTDYRSGASATVDFVNTKVHVVEYSNDLDSVGLEMEIQSDILIYGDLTGGQFIHLSAHHLTLQIWADANANRALNIIYTTVSGMGDLILSFETTSDIKLTFVDGNVSDKEVVEFFLDSFSTTETVPQDFLYQVANGYTQIFEVGAEGVNEVWNEGKHLELSYVPLIILGASLAFGIVTIIFHTIRRK